MAHDGFSALGAALGESEVVDYDRAWSMPKGYYTSPDALVIEKDVLFGRE